MKHTLKNRPRHKGFGLLGEYEKWFEGFEKRQREVDVESWVKEHLTEDKPRIIELANGIRLYIQKEVLGE